MRRGLVLSAGLAWSAYQVGALWHLVRERELRFDVCAGTGNGALSAAMVACGAFDALDRCWRGMSLLRLLRPNLRHPWRGGPMTAAPILDLVAAHTSEDLLRDRGTRLLVSTMNLQTGREEVLEYPGCDLPLARGLAAAVATPGVCPPVVHQGRQLAEGTVISPILLHAVMGLPLDEVVAVASTRAGGGGERRVYGTWRAVLERAVVMKTTHQVRAALDEAARTAAARRAFRHAATALPERLAARVSDPELRRRLETRLGGLGDA